MIGSAILIPLAELLQGEFGDKLPGIQGVVYGIAIILVILFAPEGIYWRTRDLVTAWRRVAPSHQYLTPSPLQSSLLRLCYS